MKTSSKIRLAVVGVSGLMGQQLIRLIPSDPQLVQVVAVSRSTSFSFLPSEVHW